jgi:chromosome partitioning protein
VAEEVRSHFGQKVYDTVIPRNIRLGEAPSFGKPIILYDIRSRGSEAYVTLAKEFLARSEGVLRMS